VKKKSKLKEAIYTIIFMIVMTTICVGGISIVYQKSKKQISLNQEMFLRKAVLQAAGILPDNADAAKISEVFQARLKYIEADGKAWYQVNNGNFVFPVSGTGLWGKIDAVVGLKKDGKTLTGISFTKNNETPGLGARITEPWFCNQFKDKTGPMSFVPEGSKSASSNQFDAITGATITTNAVKKMVNNTLTNAPAILSEGSKK
jgi:Na+-transporting NADH:ubiquinone oxidoreductase subunit C